jgi:uncharacterized protein YdeI (YjbR/CyaY-like superfamily)
MQAFAMAARTTHPDVDTYASELVNWRAEFDALRSQLLELDLVEELKWRKPCYVHDGANIVIFQPFKELCALMFFKGVLLDDPDGLLREQGANSQSALRLEYRSLDDVRAQATALPALVRQAIENERAGLQVQKKTTIEYEVPHELLMRFDEDPHFQEAFESLTPGRQRGYLLHFADAKKPETRLARIDRFAPRIFEGLGMHD